MPNQGWQQTLMVQQGAGTLLNTYTTAKSVINTESLRTLPSGFFDTVGKQVRMTVTGDISTLVTTPGTITFQLMLGSVIAWTSGAIQLNATAHTTKPFWLDVLLTCHVVGSGTTAKLHGSGILGGIMFTNTAGQADGANTMTIMNVPTTLAADGTGFDSTQAQTVDFWAGFSISNAANGIQVGQFSFASLN